MGARPERDREIARAARSMTGLAGYGLNVIVLNGALEPSGFTCQMS